MHRFVFSLVFVFAVGKVRMNAIDLEYSAIPETCFIPGYICSIAGLEELPGTFNTPEDCYLACKATDETEGSDCKYWTYLKMQGKASCYSTGSKECFKEESHCGPSVADDSYCASGVVDCAGTVHKTAIEPEYSAVPEECFFNGYICAITGLDELTEGDPSSPEDCFSACKKVNDDGGECKYWTYYKIANQAHCYSTGSKECVHEEGHCVPSLDPLSNCASGHGKVDDCDDAAVNCLPLVLESSLHNRVYWTCPVLDIQGFDPYRDPIPSGTMCSAECSVWTDADTPENHRVSSTCNDVGGTGTWSALTPEHMTDADGAELSFTPGEVEYGNPPCHCKSIKIKGQDEPEAGMELFCTEENGVDFSLQDLTQHLTISADMRCIMFCDRHLALEITCANGDWTDNIKDCSDIYCWTKPTDCEFV